MTRQNKFGKCKKVELLGISARLGLAHVTRHVSSTIEKNVKENALIFESEKSRTVIPYRFTQISRIDLRRLDRPG